MLKMLEIMKKHLLIGTALLSLGITANAEQLTPEQALNRLPAGGPNKIASKNGAPRLVHTAKTEDGMSAVYVFNKPGDNGYMLLSADDIAYPLLGYADNGSFDPDNIPPAMEWWLEEYGRQIEYAATHGTSSATSLRAQAAAANRQEIAPMIKTDWDQGTPYNNQCPTDAGVRTYTGCVATAMAQVMNYWQYPERGTGTITYTASSLSKKLTLNLSKTAFDWDNMIDRYLPGKYTEEEADAVAYLMKACGYAVKMDYGTDSSGALAMNISRGLTKYFNYDGNIAYELRMMYSSDQWAEMIYNNLKEVGPILYGGASYIGGGHSFVCDGYKDGLFHFNWGWTGMSNGYFSLEALNPSSLGAGGGAGGGYNFTQDAVLGIQPPTGKPVETKPDQLIEMGSLVGQVARDSLFIGLEMQAGGMWVNYNPTSMTVDVALAFAPQGKADAGTTYFKMTKRPVAIAPGYGTGPEYINSANPLADFNLADGTYKVSVATLDSKDADAQWLPVRNPYTYYDYFVLTKNGSKYTVENKIPASIDIIDGGFTGELYYGCVQRVWCEVENKNDIECSTGLAPFLAGSTAQFLGESVFVSLQPHEKRRVEWTTQLYSLRQMNAPSADIPLILTFMDEGSMLVYSNDIQKQVTMKPNPGSPSISASNLKVANGKRSVVTENGGFKHIYTITDPSEIEISSRISLKSGYFAYPVVACICLTTDEGVAIETYGSGGTFFLNAGEQGVFNTTISYPSLAPDVNHSLIMAYDIGNGLVPINNILPVELVLNSAGVDDIIADAESLNIDYDSSSATVTASSADGDVELTAYNVNGAVIAAGRNILDLNRASAGVIIVKGADKAGNTRTIKVLK